jgi:hypothetical protein
MEIAQADFFCGTRMHPIIAGLSLCMPPAVGEQRPPTKLAGIVS